MIPHYPNNNNEEDSYLEKKPIDFSNILYYICCTISFAIINTIIQLFLFHRKQVSLLLGSFLFIFNLLCSIVCFYNLFFIEHNYDNSPTND